MIIPRIFGVLLLLIGLLLTITIIFSHVGILLMIVGLLAMDEQTVDFAGNGEFDGNRWNDCHYTTAFKRAARERKSKA